MRIYLFICYQLRNCLFYNFSHPSSTPPPPRTLFFLSPTFLSLPAFQTFSIVGLLPLVCGSSFVPTQYSRRNCACLYLLPRFLVDGKTKITWSAWLQIFYKFGVLLNFLVDFLWSKHVAHKGRFKKKFRDIYVGRREKNGSFGRRGIKYDDIKMDVENEIWAFMFILLFPNTLMFISITTAVLNSTFP
jgi:hypothetical protein